MGKVSIAITNYNYGAYLGRAIGSALAQTYRDIEIIVADDGSTDNSMAVARRYGKRIRLLELKHGGYSVALNAAARAARGEFILNFNSDDLLHPDYVKETMRALARGGEAAFAYVQTVGFGSSSYYFRPAPYSLRAILMRTTNFPATALIRKSAFLSVGGYDARLPFHEDWDFWLKLAEKGRRGVLVPLPLLFYRQHAGQLGARSAWEYLRMRMKLRQRHAAIFAKNLGASDRWDIFASDCALFAYMAARDVLAALRLWEPARKGMVRVAALLQPGYAYSNDVPESCRQMIKKLDSKNE